ncbi:trypsin-like serine protease [Pedobacter duraquae]|uniref:Trypsin n=1 Tax=Pedobacter duraquae TaxID=425511 RepID=A0A4R6IRA5_9SPHI|nr:trypsin-like serine protease [Pedobacter duraquae]TDO24942.1 trypsin [Pedobacter duraquae]
MKHSKLVPLSALVFLLLFAGIMRDDVAESKYTALANQKQFDCVGQVLIGGKPAGSCVLISNRFVLSAAHVFMRYQTRQDTLLVGGQKVAVNIPTSASPVDATKCAFIFIGKSYTGKALHFFPGYSMKDNKSDLVLIDLENTVNSVVPATLNMTFDEKGTTGVGVGFGASGFGMQVKTVRSKNQKIAGENSIDSLGGKLMNELSTTLICDFDSKARPELNRIGSAEPLGLEYSSTGGDSGGGMFRKKNGQWELIGICHNTEAGMDTFITNGYYGLLMEWMRISVFRNWIKSVTT